MRGKAGSGSWGGWIVGRGEGPSLLTGLGMRNHEVK